MADRDTTLSADSQPGLLRNEQLSGQAGLATYVAAKIYGSVPLPPGMPDWLKGSIDSQANFAQRLPGAEAMTIGGAGGGPVDTKTKRERQHDADAESVEYMTVRLEQAERERQQWAGERHGIAGVEMTGAEWSDLSRRLRTDDELKQRVLDAFRDRGMTDQEARSRYERVTDVAGAMAVPPSQRTEQQAAAISKAEADPSFKRDIQIANAAARDERPTNEAGRDGIAVAADPSSSQAARPVTIINGPSF